MRDRLRLSDIPRRMLGGMRRAWHRLQLGNEGRAGIDASADNRYTSKHFADASQSDINTIIETDLSVTRQRCRYEVRNNPLLRGIVNSYANHIVGIGPRLQLGTDNKEANKELEDRFSEWCAIADAGGRMSFGAQLRLDIVEHCQCGESLTAFVTATDPNEFPVQLRLQSIAPIRLGTPYGARYAENYRDGIQVDANGKAISYAIMKSHPGSTYNVNLESEDVPARNIIHLFPIIESGQYRGLPLMSPAVTLAGDLRRYTKATVGAAEAAANQAGTIESVDDEITQEAETFDEIEIPRNSLLTLPAGYKMNQMHPEQPAASYKEFKAELVNEMGSPILMPYIVAALNSQGYNYASGRLDWQAFWKAIAVVQNWFGIQKCDLVFARWHAEARLIPGYLKNRLPAGQIKRQWFWPGSEHVDPAKEATAQEKRLKNKTSTLAEEYARKGQDWERQLEQWQREQEKILDMIAELKKKQEKLKLTPEDITLFSPGKAAISADLEQVEDELEDIQDAVSQ